MSADSARHNAYFVAEGTYGTTPVNPTMKRLRHTGVTLATSKTSAVSEELRGDRQISDFRHGNKQVGGELSCELSYSSHDDLIEAVLLGTWAPKFDLTSALLTANSADDVFDIDLAVYTAAQLEIHVGDVFTSSGWTEAANNGVFKVSSVSFDEVNARIGVTDIDGDPVALTDDSGDVNTRFLSEAYGVRAGTTRRSFTVMRHFTDLLEADKPFHSYMGVELNTWSLTVAPGAIVTTTFGVLGREPALAGTAPAGSTLQAPTTTRPFDSFTGSLLEGGTTLGIVTEISMTLENGLEPFFVLFDDLTDRPSIGRSNLTGQITVRFKNATMLEKFLDETPSSLDFTLVDKAGNELRFILPNISYTGGQPDASGQGAITLAMPFQAILDPATGTQISVYRTAAA